VQTSARLHKWQKPAEAGFIDACLAAGDCSISA